MSLSVQKRITAGAKALRELTALPLAEALYGCPSRRFAVGDEIADSPQRAHDGAGES